jgi:hypothetical protein
MIFLVLVGTIRLAKNFTALKLLTSHICATRLEWNWSGAANGHNTHAITKCRLCSVS